MGCERVCVKCDVKETVCVLCMCLVGHVKESALCSIKYVQRGVGGLKVGVTWDMQQTVCVLCVYELSVCVSCVQQLSVCVSCVHQHSVCESCVYELSVCVSCVCMNLVRNIKYAQRAICEI